MSFSKRLLSSGPPPFVASENFNVVTWTGNDADGRAITVGFKPDLVWIKPRTITSSNRLFNSTRGATKFVQSDTTAAEQTASNTLQSFTNTGFTVGQSSAVNDSSSTYVAWCWKANGGTTSSNTDGSITTTVQANQDSGFSIIKYDMNVTSASAFTIGHGLSAAPELIIFNSLEQSGSTSHIVYPNNPNKEIVLDSYGAFSGSTSAYWNTTAPSSTVINMGTAWGQYYSYYGGDTIAYAFHSVEGFSKIGSYTGNGSANGPITEIGFEPAFVVAKRTDAVDSWIVLDNKRDLANPRNNSLKWDETGAEEADSSNRPIDFLSNGFQIKATHQGLNANNGTYLYMAFAADPDTEAPALASSFDVETYNMTGGSDYDLSFPFKPQFVITKTRDEAAHWSWGDIIRGNNSNLSSNDANAVNTSNQWRVKDWHAGATSVTIAQHASTSTSNISYAFKADDNEPTIFPPNQTVADIKSTNLTLNLNLAAGSYSGSGTDLIDLSAAGEDFSRSSAGNVKEGFGGYYIDLEGNDQYWTSDSSVATTTGNDITIEFWVRDEGNSASYGVLIDANHSTGVTGSTGNGWVIQQRAGNQGSFYFYYYNGTGGESNSDGELFTLTNDEWTHIAVVKSGTSIQVYKNGVAGNSWTAGNATIANPNQKIRLGQYLNSEQRNFWGSFAQVRLYSDALSSSEVTANYNATKNLFQLTQSLVSANANAGFSIVKYTSTGGTGSKVSHGLSATPNMILIKCTSDASTNWIVHHSSLGNSKYLTLNNDSVQDTSSNWLVPSATTFALNQTFGNANTSGRQYIAYCFHDVSSYQKFGSYTGNAGALTVTVGFKPDFVMIKRSDGTGNWVIIDSKRASGGTRHYANLSSTEDTGQGESFTSTGFKPRPSSTADTNISGATYIYWAVAKNVPSNTTLANSFKAVTYTGNGGTQSITGFGFKPDLVWFKARTVAYDHGLYDSVRGGSSLIYPDLAQAASTVTNGISFDEDGVTVGANNKQNASNSTYVAWAWKAGNTWQSNLDGTMPTTINANTANGFSIVKYTGQGGVKTAGHGLSSAPEMIIVKSLGHSANWYTYHIGLDASSPEDYNVRLDQTDARQDSASYWNDTAPTSSVFTIGTTTGVSQSGTDFIAYCFHSVAGFSKFGSYTGTGATGNTVTVGFQPDFVMVKSSSTTEPWFILDSVRDTSNPRDNRLMPDSSAVEDDGSVHTMAFNSTSFTLNGTLGNGTNGNGQTYIYMAFKMN